MSGTAGAAPPTAVLGLDASGPWRQRGAQRSGALIQTYLLTGSMLPPPSAAGSRTAKTPLKLPSLVAGAKGPQGRSSMARLSFSEPSLFTTSENLLFQGLSLNHRPSVLKKRPPPPPSFSKSSSLFPYKTSQPHQEVPSCSRLSFIHFSHAIQPSSRPRPVRRHSHNPALSSDMLHGDFRPSASRYQEEPLSVVGKPCLLSCGQRPAAGPARTQIHVFLPSEAEGEEADRESVDEGFMDELESKITSLKLQQGAPKTATPHS